ncbi:hypothetical protein ACFE04_023493 [Oxalis oulophora]
MAVVQEQILTSTDVNHRLSFETESLSYFSFAPGIHYIDFKVVDFTDGCIRTLRLYTRKDDHPKPVISRGWREYVKSKSLRKGDKVILRVNCDNRAPFSIQAQRAQFIVCGEPFWINI